MSDDFDVDDGDLFADERDDPLNRTMVGDAEVDERVWEVGDSPILPEIEAEDGETDTELIPLPADSSPELRAVQALADQLMSGCKVEQDEQGFWLRCHLDSPVWLGMTVLRAKRALRGIARD